MGSLYEAKKEIKYFYKGLGPKGHIINAYS